MENIIQILENIVINKNYEEIAKIINNGLLTEQHKFIFDYISAPTFATNSLYLNLKGYMYRYGIGVEKDCCKAKEVYELVIKLNDGTLDFSYKYPELDLDNIFDNLSTDELNKKKLANIGYSSAVKNLGFLYEKELGTEKDLSKAIWLYRKAIDLYNINALILLGYCYYYGTHVERNYIKAKKIFEIGLRYNDDDGITALAQMYNNGTGVAKDIQKSVELYEIAIKLDSTHAMHLLGNVYLTVFINYDKARELFEKASNYGYAPSMTSLGKMYSNDLYGIHDIPKAINFYEMAIKLNNINAIRYLANIYEFNSVSTDHKKALQLYCKHYKLTKLHSTLDSIRRLFSQDVTLLADYITKDKIINDLKNAYDQILHNSKEENNTIYI